MAKGKSSLASAKQAKNDEFYTQLSDIERELQHYTEHFKGKVVLCNCDDPRVSNFFKYFSLNFEYLGLKKLIATCYKNQDYNIFTEFTSEAAICQIYEGDKNSNLSIDENEIQVIKLKGDGDFRSEECIEYLKEADIVCTNPPFSLFREYVAQLIEYNKKFLIIGNVNAITYKEVFPLIAQNRLWLGINCTRWFGRPGTSELIEGARSYWFTNLNHKKRNEEIILTAKYSPERYPKYDNFDAIEVSRVENIPEDYFGVMGVPITFLDKYNPDQFEIVAFRKGDDGKDLVYSLKPQNALSVERERERERERVQPYFRILIRRITAPNV